MSYEMRYEPHYSTVQLHTPWALEQEQVWVIDLSKSRSKSKSRQKTRLFVAGASMSAPAQHGENSCRTEEQD